MYISTFISIASRSFKQCYHIQVPYSWSNTCNTSKAYVQCSAATIIRQSLWTKDKVCSQVTYDDWLICVDFEGVPSFGEEAVLRIESVSRGFSDTYEAGSLLAPRLLATIVATCTT